MHYTTSIPVKTNENVDFDTAKMVLLPNEFSVTHFAPKEMIFKGKGMLSTNQPSIRGATEIALKLEGAKLKLTANLGGVLFMSLISIFIAPLCVLVMYLTQQTQQLSVALMIALCALGTLMAVWIRQKTIVALNQLLKQIIHRE